MCLTVKINCEELQFKTAKQDIICYKLIFKKYNEESPDSPIYLTPFKKARIPDSCLWCGAWEDNAVFEAQGEEEIMCDQSIFNPKENIFEIGGGFIHTYKNDYDAIDHMCSTQQSLFYGEIWRCLIPKGVKYVEGRCGDDTPGYASKSIKFICRL